MRAYVEAYGCTLNTGEAEEAKELLRSKGWALCTSPDSADLAVIATCVVVEKTERRMVKRIRALSSVPRLVVTGCMATARKDVATEACPSVELVPPGDMPRLSELVEDVGAPVESAEGGADGPAIVPIATGCMGSCSYCITRLARGRLKSRPVEDVVRRVSALVEDGPREVRLTSQDTSVYGLDTGSSLPELLSAVSELEGDFRIRIGMMNPLGASRIADDLVRSFDDERLFKFVHLPVQSASDAVLERMMRGHTYSEFAETVSTFREGVPGLTLSTDLIVGYPGETDADHRANLAMILDIEPDIVNVTRFSPRPGTPAASADCPVVGWRAKERSRELTAVRFEVSARRNAAQVGRRVPALATERGRDGSTALRTDEYLQVVVPERLPLGGTYEVDIVESTPTYLLGERVR